MDDNQRSWRARRTTASPWRFQKPIHLDADVARAAMSLRRRSSSGRGSAKCLLALGGRASRKRTHGAAGSSKRQCVDTAPHRSGPGISTTAAAALLLAHGSSHEGGTIASGVMQPSAIGAGDDCCDRGRSRSSRALWRRAARQAAPVLTMAPPLVAIVALTRGRDRRRSPNCASYNRNDC
jgi:hypothetical protein